MAAVYDQSDCRAPHPKETICCFYCLKPVELPAVNWCGYSGDIWLHPKCTEQWVIHLAKDAFNAAVEAWRQKKIAMTQGTER